MQMHVRLIAPRYVTYNSTATMHCNHSVPDEFLHKVEFMKDDKRILQYIKDRKPPFHRGEVEGASMEVSCTQLTQLSSPLSSLPFNYAVFKQLRSHTCRRATPTPLGEWWSSNRECFFFPLFFFLMETCCSRIA